MSYPYPTAWNNWTNSINIPLNIPVINNILYDP